MPTIVLTSGTKWFVPADCQTATVEAIGAGQINGGAYAKSSVSFTPGTYADISIGAGASGSQTWLNTVPAIKYSPAQVVWNGSSLVGVDNTNNIVLSSDGISWTQKPGALAILTNISGFVSVASVGSIIVAVANDSISSTVKIAQSSDGGATWNSRTLPTSQYNKQSLICLNGVFILTTLTSSGGSAYKQFTSSDGVTWVQVNSNDFGLSTPSTFPAYALAGIYGNSVYTLTGQYNSGSGVIYGLGYAVTADGPFAMVSAASLQMSGQTVNGVAFGNSAWVVVGGGGKISTASTISGTWTARTSGTTNQINSVVFDGAKFIAIETVPALGTKPQYARALISDDGVTWTISNTAVPSKNLSNSTVYAVSAGTTTYTWSFFAGVQKTTNSGSSWTWLVSGTGAPTSATYGVTAAGGSTASAYQEAASVFTVGSGNLYIGGEGADGFICCCVSASASYGGSAGPNGNGGSASANNYPYNGGGGGANGGGNAALGVSAGGVGGTGRLGAAGGAGGTVVSPPGGAGSAGSGGGGSYGTGAGGAGSLDAALWTSYTGATYGVGSGGGSGTGGGAAGGPGAGGTGALGQGLIVITYTSTPLTGTYTQVFTSTQDVYIPSGVTSLTAHAIGPGSQGGKYTGVLENGGGGGAYATSTIASPASGAGYANVPSASAWGATADSWFRALGNTAPTTSAQGALAKGASNGAGGAGSGSSIGSTVYAGGNGGNSVLQTSGGVNKQRGGGGAGAAGPDGVGKNGGSASTAAATSANGGGGGGGGTNAGSSTAGGTTTSTTGGAGGAGPTGTAGGTGGTTSVLAGAGSNGSGGGGGSAYTTSTPITLRQGAAGSQYNIWTADGVNYGPGSGGGGGGIGTSTTLFGNGGPAGGYGGGGGAASGVQAAAGVRGSGTGGLVVIAYTVVGSGTTYERTISEAATVADLIAATYDGFVAVSETATGTDAASAQSVFSVLTAESATATDSFAVLVNVNAAMAETTTASDVVSAIKTVIYSVSINEQATAVDVVVVAPSTFGATVAEVATALDSLRAGLSYNVQFVDSATATDAVIGAFLWNLINDSQTPNWQNASNTQALTWTVIDTNQTPGWTPATN